MMPYLRWNKTGMSRNRNWLSFRTPVVAKCRENIYTEDQIARKILKSPVLEAEDTTKAK